MMLIWKDELRQIGTLHSVLVRFFRVIRNLNEDKSSNKYFKSFKVKHKIYDIKNILFLEVKISKKGKVRYWANVNLKLKRIAQVYFLQLKNKGLKIIYKNNKISLKKKIKNKCLGFTKQGVQCSRLVLKGYCY